MIDTNSDIPNLSYVDTPQGIFTAAGNWFRARKDALEAYAGPVLEHESLERLLGRTEVWLRSPETIVLWALPIFMIVIEPLPAILAAVTIYIGWKGLGPSLVSLGIGRVLDLLDRVWLQGAYYVGILSYLASLEMYVAVLVGLIGFVFLRWGLVGKVVGPVVRVIWATLYELPIADQILRGFIMRTAMKHRVALPQLEKLERQILEMFSKT